MDRLRAGLWVVMAAALALGASWARAQDDDDREDPPGRVARLNYFKGTVSFRPATRRTARVR